jgi:hypothetical protein
MVLDPERCRKAVEKASKVLVPMVGDNAMFNFTQIVLDWDSIACWVVNTHLQGVNDQVAQVLSAIDVLRQVKLEANSIVLVSKNQVLVDIRLPFEEQNRLVIDVDLLDKHLYGRARRWCCAAWVVCFGIFAFVVNSYDSYDAAQLDSL